MVECGKYYFWSKYPGLEISYTCNASPCNYCEYDFFSNESLSKIASIQARMCLRRK